MRPAKIWHGKNFARSFGPTGGTKKSCHRATELMPAYLLLAFNRALARFDLPPLFAPENRFCKCVLVSLKKL
jgi:hypothetical protein